MSQTEREAAMDRITWGWPGDHCREAASLDEAIDVLYRALGVTHAGHYDPGCGPVSVCDRKGASWWRAGAWGWDPTPEPTFRFTFRELAMHARATVSQPALFEVLA